MCIRDRQDDHKVIFDRLLDSATFDLYISTTQDVWKLETCVIQDGSFQINKSRPLRLTVNGEASKLSKHSGTIPGTVQSVSDITYIIPTLPAVTIGGTDISDSVVSIQAEIQNDIEWNKNDTIHGVVAATDAATSIYPTNFINGTRIVGGSITRYYDKDAPDILTWNTNTALRIRAGKKTDAAIYGVDFNITNCSFTNRLSTADTFLEEYNWRMTQNPTALSSVITYTTT